MRVTLQRDRFDALNQMSRELQNENYHAKERVKAREAEIMAKWRQLMDMLEKKRRILTGFSDLLSMFRDIESIQVEMKGMEVSRERQQRVLKINPIWFTMFSCFCIAAIPEVGRHGQAPAECGRSDAETQFG